MIYEKTPIEFVQRLEKKIEAEIAKRIERERANLEQGKRAYRTKWDRGFGERIRNILLTSFEAFKYRTRVTGTKVLLIWASINSHSLHLMQVKTQRKPSWM